MALTLFGCASKISSTAGLSENQTTSWLRAASKGDVEFIKQNLNMIGTVNVNGTSALMASCARGHVEVAKILLDAGEDPNLLDSHKDSALFYSIAQNQESTFDLLMQKKVRLNSTRLDGISPLMIAIDNNRTSMAEKLIGAGVDVNEVTEDGWSALFFTIRMKNLDVAKRLIKAGAKAEAKDNDGKTILDYAKEDGWVNGVHFFQQFIKNPKKKLKSGSQKPNVSGSRSSSANN